jgi:hypothetical protein
MEEADHVAIIKKNKSLIETFQGQRDISVLV